MAVMLYNTLTNKEEPLEPIMAGHVRMYTCGPTVYGRPHIGNYSSFLLADLLRRWLEAGHGYQVTHVKNVTDVGHLVADADDGEDKIEKQAREESGEVTHDSVIGIARKYEAMYLADEDALNFKQPEHRPRATEVIDEIIAMTQTLVEKDHAYETEDGVYYRVESFPSYGQLSGNTLENLSAGARISVDENKEHPADFALWKKCVGINEHHALRWDSPWGPGFPGWHIECSCMSKKFLGEQFDIHTGGEDLIFPHHECEIAQCEAASGKERCVGHWVHRRFIDMGDEKMSKSLGNVLTLPDIEAMGFSPLDLRYYLLSVHYRTNLKFTKKGLEDAHKARRKVLEWMREVEGVEGKEGIEGAEHPSAVAMPGVEEWTDKFAAAMNSDLNTPEALAVVFAAMTWSRTNNTLSACKKLAATIRDTFGCFEPEELSVPVEVQALLDQRAEARANKDFAASDQLRDQIAALGYEVKDTDEGQVVTKL